MINNNHNKNYYVFRNVFRKQKSLQYLQSWSLINEVMYLHVNKILLKKIVSTLHYQSSGL